MKKHLFSIILFSISVSGFGQCLPPSAHAHLDVNNVSARINNSMSMFWNELNVPGYEVPKGSGKHSLFTGSLWIGGQDANGQLRLAAVRFRQTGNDYYPGPLDTLTGQVAPETCTAYDRIWKLNRWEVAEFRERFDEPGYQIPQAIMEWPAQGNASLNQTSRLAPFKDVNNDGLYDPLQGDYPAFVFEGETDVNHDLLGDQVLWWVINDNGGPHTESNGNPIRAEIHCMAYAFGTCDFMNDQTFYRYTVINRGPHSLSDTYIGLWKDVDLGNAQDDYVACDVVRGMGYAYNGYFTDGTGGPTEYGADPPAIGVDMLRGPLAAPDGQDNDGDGTVDNETLGMSKFVYHNNDNSVIGDPATAADYYNYMRGIWADGTPMCYGGNGHPNTGASPDIPCHYMFPGDSDPMGIGTGGVPVPLWTEETAGNVPFDRRFLMSSGPFDFEAGMVQHLHAAVVWARDTVNSPTVSVEALKATDDLVQAAFDSDFENLGCCPPKASIVFQQPGEFHFLFTSMEEGESYQWDFGDGNTTTGRFPSHQFDDYGTYEVCLTVSNGCGTSTTCESVTVAPPPVGVELTRIEGSGNMGRSLRFVDGMHDSLFVSSANRIYHPTYDFHRGPVRVEVLDSTLLPAGEMVIALNGVTESSSWKMYPVGGTDTVFSSSTISVGDAQLIAQWGLLVQVKQADWVEDVCDVLDCTIEQQANPWLTWLPDTDLPSYSNWIRSGVSMTDVGLPLDGSDYGDPLECYETVLNGTWAPWKLACHESGVVSPTWSRYKALNDLENISSVDIVITPDKDRWTRCPVVEIADENVLSIGDARRFDLRKSPSVDKNGNPDGSGTMGMSWFPGYAVNVETGERLNMAFGENSWFPMDNGADMIWNPTSLVETSLGDLVLGGGHYIYVFGHNGNDPDNDVPLYDGGEFIFQKLSGSDYVPADTEKRRVYKDAMWVGIPMLAEGGQLLQSPVTIRLRVRKPYVDYECLSPIINGTHPMYSFFTDKLSIGVDEDASAGNSGLNVYPNPTSGMLTVELAGKRAIDRLYLYSVTGGLMLRQEGSSGETTRQLDLSSLPAGIYFLVVETNAGADVRRVVVE